jgi:hypothetical protein
MDSVLVKSATGLMLLTGIVMMFPDYHHASAPQDYT